MKHGGSKFEVQVVELNRLQMALIEKAATLQWATNSRPVLDELAADCGSRHVQRSAALVGESVCRVTQAVAHELVRIARLAEAAGVAYRAVDGSVLGP